MKKENLKSDEVKTDSSKTNDDKGYPILKPKIDVVFQSLFSKNNPKITKAFAEALLGEKIYTMKINDDKELTRKNVNDKLGILDLELSVNDYEKVDVEVQLINRNNFVERLLYYFSKLYESEIGIGKDYKTAKRVVIVAIIDFPLDITKEISEMTTIWRLYEQTHKDLLLTSKIEIDIIELKKAKSTYINNKDNKKAQWVMFLDDPNSKEVKEEIMKNNEDIEEAVITVKEMSEEEQLQRLADLRLKAIMDEKSIYAAGLDDGKKEGIELGKKAGIELGKKEEHKKLENIVKNLLSSGMEIGEIVKITGLSKDEIEKIQASI